MDPTSLEAQPTWRAHPGIRIGALAPLTAPGWVEAGHQLLAGIQLGVLEVNGTGGIDGKPLELIVRNTAGDPQKGVAAVDELADLGVAALIGEYHSVVAKAISARADELRLPFLCSSAVLDGLAEAPSNLVARLAPAQSHGWRVYADFLVEAGHASVILAVDPSAYWAAGSKILQGSLASRGVTVSELDLRSLDLGSLCDELVARGATAVVLLVGYPRPAVPIVETIRRDRRLKDVMIGAPAGQPEFANWTKALGMDGAAVPFLRYLPERLSPLGRRVEAALCQQLAEAPSFVAFEGYDTMLVLAELLSCRGDGDHCDAVHWPSVSVEGSRGRVGFSRVQGVNVWQWAWAPVQVVDRDPSDPRRFRTLYRREGGV